MNRGEPVEIDLNLKRGDDSVRTIQLSLRQASGVIGYPDLLTGQLDATFHGPAEFTLTSSGGTPTIAVVEDTVTPAGDPATDVTLTFDRAVVVTVGTYRWDLQHTDASGNKATLVEGVTAVTQDQTA